MQPHIRIARRHTAASGLALVLLAQVASVGHPVPEWHRRQPGRALPAARPAPRTTGGSAQVPSATNMIHWLDGHADYAPSGMPDFSQCRPEWSLAGNPGQWTHAGPVALAAALWWLDSAAETRPVPPPTPADSHPLVTAYPAFGPARDDHSAANVGPLVEDLAHRADTDGRRTGRAGRGTRWEDLVTAIASYLRERRLDSQYSAEPVTRPQPGWLAAGAARGAGIVLLLGIWESQSGAWRRIGGHYVTVAGASRHGDTIAVADPLADAVAWNGSGRMVPRDESRHSCRTAPRDHDNAAVVALDAYSVTTGAEIHSDAPVLRDYFTPANYGEAAAFRGLNPSLALADHDGDWRRGRVVMVIDAAIAVARRGEDAATRTATPGQTPSQTASAPATAPAIATSTPLPGGTPVLSTPTPGAPPTTWQNTGTIAPVGDGTCYVPWTIGGR